MFFTIDMLQRHHSPIIYISLPSGAGVGCYGFEQEAIFNVLQQVRQLSGIWSAEAQQVSINKV